MAKILDFVKQIFQGKTIYRVLFNWQVKKNCCFLSGKALDLAGSGDASYCSYLPINLKITKANYKNGKNLDLIIDFNKDLSFEDNSFDNILFFNSIYIAKNRAKLLKELKRILKGGGKLFLSSPFIVNEMPEPNDFCRLTYEGLETGLKQAGFEEVKIIRFGERFSAASNLLHRAWLFNIIRLFVYSISLFLDKIIPRSVTRKHSCPLGYFCIIKKTKNL